MILFCSKNLVLNKPLWKISFVNNFKWNGIVVSIPNTKYSLKARIPVLMA